MAMPWALAKTQASAEAVAKTQASATAGRRSSVVERRPWDGSVGVGDDEGESAGGAIAYG